MTIEEMKKRKIELGFTNRELSARSGVPEATIQKLFSGTTKAPRRKTILALEKVLMPSAEYDFRSAGDPRVAETADIYRATLPDGVPHKKQGDYTLEDYDALPEDQRAELIDGVLYDMAPPTLVHQIIAFQVAYQFQMCIEDHDSPCEVYITPVGVQLDRDNKTMLEPDLVILCDRSKEKTRCIYGAPDFVMEVLSPSTRRKDLTIKLGKYLHAGCREYWIVDPDDRSVTVYYFEGDEIAIRYTFDDKIPVRISEGECTIDFSKIRSRIERGSN